MCEKKHLCEGAKLTKRNKYPEVLNGSYSPPAKIGQEKYGDCIHFMFLRAPEPTEFLDLLLSSKLWKHIVDPSSGSTFNNVGLAPQPTEKFCHKFHGFFNSGIKSMASTYLKNSVEF